MYKLYSFNWYFGRDGELSGVFIAKPEDVENLYGKYIDFGEALGKHSCVRGTIEKDEIKEIPVSEQTIIELKQVLGNTISGYNPFDYMEQNDI